MTYLGDAERDGETAASLLEAARAAELEIRSFDATVDARLASAAAAEQETISRICGASTAVAECAPAREPRARLGETDGSVPGLGLIPDPGPAPAALYLDDCVEERAAWGRCTVLQGNCSAEYLAYRECQEASHPYTCAELEAEAEHRTGHELLQVLEQYMACARHDTLVALAASEIERVPTTVVRAVQASSRTGVFAPIAVGGGESLQELLRAQQALEDIRQRVRSVVATMDLLANEMANLKSSWDDIDSFWDCLLSGIMTTIRSLPEKITNPSAALAAGSGLATVISCNSDAGRARDRLLNDAQSTLVRAVEELATSFDQIRASATIVRSVDGRLADLEREIAMAATRREIDERLARTGVTGDPAWRASVVRGRRDADLALDRALRAAFTARRAIEVHFAEDMSTMTADEAYVAGPAFWAHDVFAIRTATHSEIVDGATVSVDERAEDLREYLRSLRHFATGYNQPTADHVREFRDGSDTAIVNLGALAPPDPYGLPFHTRVLFRCNDGSELMGGTPAGHLAEEPCAEYDGHDHGGVERAVLTFGIPTDLASDGYMRERFAVGTTTIGCDRSASTS